MTPRPPRFLDVGGRLVCWRAAGAGPASVLVHGSPQSSRALAGLGEAVAAAGLCAIMPDTPGAGHSQALEKPGLCIADLADALAAFVDAIGLQKFALYGTHTGAAIACAFAARQPGRVTALVLDGIAAWTEEERDAYATDYAPPFTPSWDGAHMTWLWSRMEAQSLFFPWHRQDAAAWRDVDLSPPWHLHRNAMDMLDAGDAYRAIYQASLAFDPAAFMGDAGPAEIMTLASDVLRGHAGRPALAGLPVRLFGAPAALWAAVAASLAASPGDTAPALPAPLPFWRGTAAGPGRPLVLLHAAGASSRAFDELRKALAGPVIAFDLPGHGFDESAMPATAAGIAAVVTGWCRALGFEDAAVAGKGFGGVIAQAMAGGKFRAAGLGPRAPAADLRPHGALDLTPAWDGGHLLRAWRVAWRQALFTPWYRCEAGCAAPPEHLSPDDVHAAAVDLLRAGPAWLAASRIEAAAAGDVETILPGPPDQWPASLNSWR